MEFSRFQAHFSHCQSGAEVRRLTDQVGFEEKAVAFTETGTKDTLNIT
jgi:hypothetical protein